MSTLEKNGDTTHTLSHKIYTQKELNSPQFEDYLASLVKFYEDAAELNPYLRHLQTMERTPMNRCERCGRFCRNTTAVSRGNGSYDPVWLGPCCAPNRHNN